MESARPAVTGDLDDMVTLWQDALAELEGQRGGEALAGSLARSDLPGFLHAALGDPDRLVVLGLFDGVPVGVASLRADRNRREPVGELELLYVVPDARQVGVGNAMLSLVLSRCQELGLAGLDAAALPGNRNAKAFFETQGMHARLLIMHRPLGERDHG